MCLFRKAIHKPSSPAPMPTWEETVEIMYDKNHSGKSIFNSMDLLMNELTKEPEYIAHFA